MSAPTLRAGIIAAGRGERLRTKAPVPKPLVKVGGRTLIEHVLTSFESAGASEVAVIINEESQAVRDHVSSFRWPFDIRWIVETTPSSMHSFLRVVEELAQSGDDGPFLISTVDTVATPGAYAHFMAEARRHTDAVLALAVAPRGLDEKPLLVELEGAAVVAIGDDAGSSEYATAGLYAARATILREASDARRDQLHALRALLGRLVARGYPVVGIPIPMSIDVDDATDARVAEELVRRWQKSALGG